VDRGLDPDARARRRAEAQQRTRRRRTAALGALAALVLAIGAVGALSLGGNADVPALGPDAASATDTSAAPATARPRSPARAAEPPPARSEPPGQRLPILMYHVTEAAPAGAPFPELWVAPERFAEQMQMLEDAGYHPIAMRDAEDYWAGERRIPRKPIVLTFDDGYRSHVRVAMPELRRRGWPGVLYLEVAALKKPGAEGVSRAGVRKLIDAGWELGGHTMTHPDLTTLSPAALTAEVAGSRKLLARMFDVPVDAFCYPAGKYDDSVIAAVERAGYAGATTVEEGLAGPPGDTPLTRHRIRVNGSDTADSLAAKLAAAGG
jgi:peptidoglycan/xylan/chitin deacetylase (PgdA/CDA1 family)